MIVREPAVRARRGVTLIEMMVVIGAVAMLLGLCAVTIQLLLRVSSDAQARRGAAMALAVFALWAGCFTLTYTFPLMNQAFGPARTFWIYAAICVLGFAFILRQLPETKGKTLEEIETQLEMPGITPVAESGT